MKIRQILNVAILLFPVLVLSQSKSETPETEKMLDNFFIVYQTEGHEAALTKLLATSKWISAGDAENVITKMKDFVKQVGKYHGFERVKMAHYGDCVIQYTYLAKYDAQPLKLTFRFYKPNDKWQLQGFNFVTDFTDELDEASKAYRFKENLDY